MEEPQTKTPPMSDPAEVSQIRPAEATSSRKIEANRRNAQHSTGPKTPEGKAKSSRNATTHGIFVRQFLHGAAPETVAEIEALAAGMRECYKPEGILEEILVQKIVVETARYGRVLELEHLEPKVARIDFLNLLDRVVRYTTSTSRALFRAVQELERLQAARKARESSADSSSPLFETNEDQADSQFGNHPVHNSSALDDSAGAAGEVNAA